MRDGRRLARRPASLPRLRPALLPLALAGALAACALPGPSPPAPPTTIVLVSLDTLRADYLNCYGYEAFETSPFLDSFAGENLLFENVFVPEGMTLTSHMSLFTGLLPHRHGVDEEAALSDRVPTLAGLLRAAGYRTQAFADGGWMESRWGFDRGFEAYNEYRMQGLSRILPDAIEWLRERRDEKLFLFLHTYDVHSRGAFPLYRTPRSPYHGLFSGDIRSPLKGLSRKEFEARFEEIKEGPSEADKQYVRATYAEGVKYVDEQVGRLVAALKEMNRYEDTLLVIWSDHGEGLFDHKHWSHPELFEHTLRVPLLMRIPGQPGGKRVRSLIQSVDLMPTILELAGVEVPGGLDGESVLGLLAEDRGERLAWGARTRKHLRLFSLRSQSYHYILDFKARQALLFDAREDPHQVVNLAGSLPAVEREMRSMLVEFVREFDEARQQRSGEHLPLDQKTQEDLKALGYLQ